MHNPAKLNDKVAMMALGSPSSPCFDCFLTTVATGLDACARIAALSPSRSVCNDNCWAVL
jgi:hypothetical protein